MTLTLAPSPWFTGLDNSGVTLPGAKLFTYESGTTTKLATYSDAAGTVANANPLVLDAAGRAVMYLQPQAYKFVLAPSNDTDPPLAPIKTIDPVGAVPTTDVDLDVSGLAGETLTAGQAVMLADGSNGLTAGQWYKANASTGGGSVGAKAIGVMQTNLAGGAPVAGPIRMAGRVTGLAGLAVGSVYYQAASPAGTLTATAPPNARQFGVADSANSLILGEKADVDVRRVAGFIASVSNVGAGEDVLASFTVPDGLWINGQAWEGRFWGDQANNANAKQLRFRLIEGANNNLVANFPLVASIVGMWDLTFSIIRTGAATFFSTAVVINGIDTGPISRGGNNVLVTGVATFANSCELRLTGEATTNGDVRMLGGYIKRVGVV